MASLVDVSLRQLQYVVAVADTLDFHRAAARCHVSQPSLSAQVKQLEDVLGVAIFERDRRRVLVTPAGEAVVARARRALREVEDLVATVAHLRDPLAGPVRLGVIPTIAPYALPEVVPSVHAAYPALKLIFREEKTESVVAGLRAGTLDTGLVALEADLGEARRARRRRGRSFVAALPAEHRLAKKKTVTEDDLDGETVLLLDDGHCLRSSLGRVHARRRGRVRAPRHEPLHARADGLRRRRRHLAPRHRGARGEPSRDARDSQAPTRSVTHARRRVATRLTVRRGWPGPRRRPQEGAQVEHDPPGLSDGQGRGGTESIAPPRAASPDPRENPSRPRDRR
ncbi:MAG: LysR family transcriptional regulator [Polyangiaceae bacterium]